MVTMLIVGIVMVVGAIVGVLALVCASIGREESGRLALPEARQPGQRQRPAACSAGTASDQPLAPGCPQANSFSRINPQGQRPRVDLACGHHDPRRSPIDRGHSHEPDPRCHGAPTNRRGPRRDPERRVRGVRADAASDRGSARSAGGAFADFVIAAPTRPTDATPCYSLWPCPPAPGTAPVSARVPTSAA